MEYKNFKVVYRRYASLYFIIGVDNSEVSAGFIHMYSYAVSSQIVWLPFF